ncbi:MAG: hypothetical protein MRY64_12955 [Hyphomonadaceae bacterium]|nr:hypothetical protein [Hyphomonadaceae bacterium]
MIVMIVFGAGIINNWIKMKRETGNTAENSAELDALREEVSALKRRVATLERLAVDKDTHLRDEISRLA